jgi:hypothetical protein
MKTGSQWITNVLPSEPVPILHREVRGLDLNAERSEFHYKSFQIINLISDYFVLITQIGYMNWRYWLHVPPDYYNLNPDLAQMAPRSA